jgi:hypothetical protein
MCNVNTLQLKCFVLYNSLTFNGFKNLTKILQVFWIVDRGYDKEVHEFGGLPSL